MSMRLEKIINNPKIRLTQVLETLKSEFGIEIDFTDIESLVDLQKTAQDTAKIVKANESFNTQHENPQVVCSYLILEAIKMHEIAGTPEKDADMPTPAKQTVKEGNELDKAELLLASKNIVDDLQNMIEDISKMQVQKMPPIIDRIKIEYGLGQAANYREQAMGAIQSIMDALNNAKDAVDNLTMGLSGDVDMAQAEEPMAGPPTAKEPDSMEKELDKLDKEETPTEPSAGTPEGRERKYEESKKKSGNSLEESKVEEDLNLAAKTVRKLVKHDKMDMNRAVKKVHGSIVGKDEKEADISREAKKVMGEGEEAGQNMGMKEPPELKAWHVLVHSPATKKLFGNYKIWSATPDIAKKKAQDAVMEKHGMNEWNDEYEFTIKPITNQVHESTPPGMEHWVKANKAKFKKEYGKRGMEVLYATAWKMHDKKHGKKNETADNGSYLTAFGAGESSTPNFAMEGKTVTEMASGGATAAGAIASIPQPLFKKKKVISRTMENEGELDEASRKHFRATAETLKHIEDMHKRKELASHHADIFAQQNPRFDRKKFMSAAGIDECGMGMMEGGDTSYEITMVDSGKTIRCTEKQAIEHFGKDEWEEIKQGYSPHIVAIGLQESKAKLGSGARFKKVAKAAKKGGARNPAAVAAAAGIKKYGKKKMAKLAHHESIEENWGKKDTVNPAKKGMFKGKTMAELEHELATLHKKKEHTAAETTKMRELNFAIRAKKKKHPWGKVKEDSNAQQTLSYQKAQGAADASQVTYNKGPAQSPIVPKQVHAPLPLGSGSMATMGGKKVRIAQDHGNMVSIQDTANGPTRMVPKASLSVVDPQQGTEEPHTAVNTQSESVVNESHKMEPKQRAHRINRRALKRHDHNDFIDLIHANLGRKHAEVAEDCLHGGDYEDHDAEHLHKIAEFAKKRGEHNLAYDIKTHFLPEVGAPTPTGTGPVHPDQAAVVTAPPAHLSTASSKGPTNNHPTPYRLHVETVNGKVGKKSFTNEAEAKKWLAENGHHLKSVKVDM